ncbi:MAG TPA: dTMP kinase, partial [Candidatus Andersenbacteria bacterium]|nr:dTMP kinase [Candidatus Andersenbacteria bacterium]
KEGYIPHQYHFPQEDKATGRIIYDKFLLYQNKEPFSRREQALLFIQDFFSKQEELNEIITNGKKKSVVVSDRFAMSTMAYQTIGLTGNARKKMIDWITWLCYKGKPVLPKPDIVLFLDTPVEISLLRLKNKKKDFHENREKLTAFRNSYLKVAKEQKWIVFNSVDENGEQRTREELHEEIWSAVHKRLTK